MPSWLQQYAEEEPATTPELPLPPTPEPPEEKPSTWLASYAQEPEETREEVQAPAPQPPSGAPETPPQEEPEEKGWLASLRERMEERTPYEQLLSSPPIAAARHLSSGAARVGSGALRGMELAGGAASDLAGRVGLDTVSKGLEAETARARTVAESLEKVPQLLQTDDESAGGYFDRIKEAPERTPEVVFQAFMENAPQLLASGAALAKAGTLAGTGWMWLQEGGHEYAALKGQGATEEEARAGGAATGAINALLERVPIQRLLKGVDTRSGKELLRFMMKQSGVEGGTEGLQELVSNLTERSITGEPLDAQRLMEAASVGGLLGFVAGGAAGRPEIRTQKEVRDEDRIQPRLEDEGAEGAVEEPAEVRPVEPREGDLEGVRPRPEEGDEGPGAEAGQLEAPSHAGQAGESPEAIARVARGERYYRVTPGGEVLPIPNTVDAVDVKVNPGEAKVRLTADGGLEVEQGGRGGRAQSEAIARLREEGVPEPPTPTTPEGESEVYELDTGEGLPSETPAPTVVERLPASEPSGESEAGFVRQPDGLVKDLKSFIRRNVREGGNLPKTAWELKLKKDHNIAAHEKGLQFRLRELNQKVRRYDGPLTKKQLTRYLGDALRGNVPIRIQAETAQFDETQVQRIASRRGMDPEDVRAEFSRTAEEEPSGAALAPEFVRTISKIRSDIDGVTRALRREGLLDDARARDLEREFGLYVHRSYEAFKDAPRKYLRRVEQEPLWNRAKEIVSKEHPDFTEEEVEGLLRKLIERGDRATLPGNVPEGAKNRSTLFQRKTIRDLERLLLGERRDIRSQAVDTLIGQVSLLEHERFLKALREDGLGKYLFERETGEFYRPIDEEAVAVPILEQEGQPAVLYRRMGSKKTAPVSGLHTSPEILEELERAGPRQAEFPMWLKVWSMGNLAVKLNLTAASPQTTARNYQSNLLPALTNGYLPFGRGSTEALELISRDLFNSSDDHVRERLTFYRGLGLVDQNADYGDLKRLGRFADLMRVEQDPGGRVSSWMKATVRKTGDLYSHGDNFWKILGWHKERARLERANPDWSEAKLNEEAASIVRKTLQNYSELPRVARAISANPVVAPFFSFTWAMARGTVNTTRQAVQEVRSENPETRRVGMRRAAGLMLGLSLPEMMSHAFAWWSNTDNEDRDALREFVYPWDRNANLGIVHHEPGRYVYFNWGFMDYFSRLKEPIYALHRALTTDTPTEEILSELGEDFGEEVLLSSLIDATRGETASGFPVWLETDTATAKLAKGVEHIWETGRPGAARSVERISEGVKGHRTLWPELVALVGPRITEVDVGESLGRYGSHFTRQLSGATRQYTQFANRKALRDPEDLLSGYRRANEVRRELIRELKRKIDAGVQSGLSIDEVEEELTGGGMARKYFDMALEGYIPPLDYERGNHWQDHEDGLRGVKGEFE